MENVWFGYVDECNTIYEKGGEIRINSLRKKQYGYENRSKIIEEIEEKKIQKKRKKRKKNNHSNNNLTFYEDDCDLSKERYTNPNQ
jgi:hypothetical protein